MGRKGDEARGRCRPRRGSLPSSTGSQESVFVEDAVVMIRKDTLDGARPESKRKTSLTHTDYSVRWITRLVCR